MATLYQVNRVNSGCDHEQIDSTDWELWLEDHVPALLLYARQQCRNEADAQDLVQEAAVECWRRRVPGHAPAVALAYATIRRRAIDLARSSQRRGHRESMAVQQTGLCWFDESLEDRERARLLQQGLGSLVPEQREAITLKLWGGLTFEEVGEALGIPANTAASRYRYGLEQLRKILKETLV